MQLAILAVRSISTVPEKKVEDVAEESGRLTAGSCEGNLGYKILTSEHFVQDRAEQMDILLSNLHKEASTLGQQIARHDQSIAQIGEVGVNPQLPRVAERLDHLRLA